MIYNSIQQAALATSIALTAIRQSHGNLDLGDDKVVSVIEVLQDNWLSELKPAVKMDCNPNDILVFTYVGFMLSIQIKDLQPSVIPLSVPTTDVNSSKPSILLRCIDFI